ncbi:hypothetical protein JOQ06_015608, partial [Pogonophryne albipinna]
RRVIYSFMRWHIRETVVCARLRSELHTAGNLRIHMRIHSGKPPYGCTLWQEFWQEGDDRAACPQPHGREAIHLCFTQLSCFYKHPCQRRSPPTARSNHT